jgi:putative membrane protein
VQHYLRGEDGIYYEDLYHLVKFLPAYALPTAIPSMTNLHRIGSPTTPTRGGFHGHQPDALSMTSATDAHAQTAYAHPAVPGALSPLDGPQTGHATMLQRAPSSQDEKSDRIPLPILTSPTSPRKARPIGGAGPTPLSPLARGARPAVDPEEDVEAAGGLAPAHNPPAWGAFDVFPLSLLVKARARRGKEMKGKKAMRARAKLRGEAEAHNIPLEVSLYLVRKMDWCVDGVS